MHTARAAIAGAPRASPPVFGAAARAGKRILLANKEALVMSGAIFMDAVRDHGAVLLPDDSEHNAIFQCLPREAELHGGVSKIILTASGGPFRTREPASLVNVTPGRGLQASELGDGPQDFGRHRLTMMNKGPEVIEAHRQLFAAAVRADRGADSSAERDPFDGVVRRRLGARAARQPRHAHADRSRPRVPRSASTPGVAQLDLVQVASLSFEKPDYARFPCVLRCHESRRRRWSRERGFERRE